MNESEKAIAVKNILGINFEDVEPTTIKKNGKEYTGKLYEDFKTFHRWIESGYKVIKGETHIHRGVSFIKDKKTGESYPKGYCLFHRSQVKAIKE